MAEEMSAAALKNTADKIVFLKPKKFEVVEDKKEKSEDRK